jgi:ADP-sugar diphosphatase
MVVTVLIEQETLNKFFLLVRQTRVAHGKQTYEHPAGMCDNSTNPYDVAVKEVSEETGLQITKSQLHLMNSEMVYTSAGLLDEGGYLFSCEVVMPKIELDSFRNKKAGAENESEYIETYVCTFEQAMSLMDSAVSQLALLLYLYK